MNVLVPIPFDLSSMMHGRNLRVVHLLRELALRCDVTCVVPDGPGDATVAVLGNVTVVGACSIRTMSPPTHPCWLARTLGFYGWNDALAAEIASRASSADVVLGFGANSVGYLWAARQQARCGRPRIVCDLIDDPYLTWRSMPKRERFSMAGLKSLVCLQLLRRRVLGSFDALSAVAPRDADSLSRATGRAVAIVPNGVEAGDTPPAESTREPLIVFTGTMDFPPNEAAACYLAERIWPRVRELLNRSDDGPHSVRLAIVGADPTPRVRALAEAPGVEVTVRVNGIHEWLHRAAVAAVPMVSGSGIKNKILEACAAGCPVVTTPLGADGLPVGHDSGIIVARTPQHFAERIVRLLDDTRDARRIGIAGWSMVRREYDWSRIADRQHAVMRGSAGEASYVSPVGDQTAERMEAALHATS